MYNKRSFTTLYPFSQEPPDQLRVAFLHLCGGCAAIGVLVAVCVQTSKSVDAGKGKAQIRRISHPNVRNFLRFCGYSGLIVYKPLILLIIDFFAVHILGLFFHIFVLLFHILAFFSTSHFLPLFLMFLYFLFKINKIDIENERN